MRRVIRPLTASLRRRRSPACHGATLGSRGARKSSITCPVTALEAWLQEREVFEPSRGLADVPGTEARWRADRFRLTDLAATPEPPTHAPRLRPAPAPSLPRISPRSSSCCPAPGSSTTSTVAIWSLAKYLDEATRSRPSAARRRVWSCGRRGPLLHQVHADRPGCGLARWCVAQRVERSWTEYIGSATTNRRPDRCGSA
jgi:hypothetical protein